MNDFVKIFQPSGILDGTKANEFHQEIGDSLEKDTTIILIDCQDVTFMDSSGLGSLVLLLKTVRAAGANIFLCSLNDQIKILFDLTGMDRIFTIFSSRDDFERGILQKDLP